ncbi:MAG: hypothetical protein ACK443_04380 [Methylococcaceae bacterium]|jgi:hypothetical protein
MKTNFNPFLITLLTGCLASVLISGCSSSKKVKTPTEIAADNANKPGVTEEIDTILQARVQAISRKNRILTLKFPDGKLAKIKVGASVKNFEQIGVGDTIKAEFHDRVEVYVAGPGGKPMWDEVQEIKKAPKGTRPGTAIIRAYEYMGTVATIDYTTREVVLRGPNRELTKITASPAVKRFNEIRQGDTVVARFIEAIDIDVTPAEVKNSAYRPARGR